ncbi:GNAT family N-acetyltransferase [Pontibacillus sp. HMF3514]|uniref:GNAT family N-acetyltransferase n=1 Tax=Pontibacillus sp. HMF3514 TaxID=2692425 RepID=UPI00131FC737|nr:GNAT family N-acetyltransferase [Pontibacillus sp. HMF3514]QHE52342.1 GNAT family N-acetyltransferase [Pontibacillus sp. HMF3514]
MELHFTPKIQKQLDVLQKIESGPIYPYQLLTNLLYEPTGVCPEVLIYMIQHLGKEKVFYFKESGDQLHEEEAAYNMGELTVSESMKVVLLEADNRRKRYNQSFITEGHVFHAMLTKDPILAKLIPATIREDILSFASVPRDMTVSLRHYKMPKVMLDEGITLLRAALKDQEELLRFISERFGDPWVKTIQIALEKECPPLYIARDRGELIGFACYDSVRDQKGVYGPMGTSPQVRTKGVGYALLHTCLEEMKQKGYEYAILGEAGPIEYYERACGAKLIPIIDY